MSLRQTLLCDQCPAEIDAAERSQHGWHSLQIHDLTTNHNAQIDLCDQCYRTATVPTLVGGRPRELG